MSFPRLETLKNSPIHMDPKQSAFDQFVNDLPGSEKEFDISAEMQGSQPEDQTTEGAPSPDGASNQDEENLPFNKNPKIQRFIERQVQKALKGTHQVHPAQREPSGAPRTESVPAEWTAMYGDTEDARKAWSYQKTLLDGVEASAIEKAYDRIKQEKEAEDTQVTEYQTFIEDSIENIEDEFGVDLSSKTGEKTRQEFLDLVQRLSPKDKAGNIKEFADFNSTWELFQSRKQAPSQTISRQKTLASRSMSRSTEAPTQKAEYQQGMGFDGVRRALGLD